jgi:hypothetical protein
MHESTIHWRTALWRQARVSLPGVGIWVVVCVALYMPAYILFEGWGNFTAAASDPLWWVQRAGGSLFLWVGFETDQHTPRWRSIPRNLIPIAGAGLSSLSLLGKYPNAWPIFTGMALLALGFDWILIRRWRVYSAVDRRARSAETPAAAPAIPG